MDYDNANVVIVSAIHFDLTPSLHAFVRQKMERLFRHEARIHRIRVELAYEQRRSGCGWFVARGHISSHRIEMNVSTEADECHKAILLLADKLDRMLHQGASFRKESRNHPHGIELAAALPKAW